MNLTDEQLLAASKAMFASNPQSKQWRDLDSCEKQIYLSHALAAAPFLQAPWEMAQPSETKAFQGRLMEQGGTHVPWQHLTRPFEQFIESRNASLIPKPVDPRREKIVTALRTNTPNAPLPLLCEAESMADRILAALDAKDGDGFGNHTWMETTVGNRKCTNCGLMSFEDPRACTGIRT